MSTNKLSRINYRDFKSSTKTTAKVYMAIGRFLRRNLVSITFPTLAVTFIWLDWNHTRKWKAQQKK